MNKTCQSLFVLFLIALLFSCGGPSRTVKVTQKFEPQYKPNYLYKTSPKAAPTGYTIGIIQPEFIQKNPPGSKESFAWDPTDRKDASSLKHFWRAISNTIEEILISKGCKVSGPFDSYEDMTFPDRERCSFLAQPTIILDLTAQTVPESFRQMPEVGGPNLETYCYGSADIMISGNVEMEYVIYPDDILAPPGRGNGSPALSTSW